jgi:peptidoglycan/LPS O-acetylase OafA/YrhL
MRPPELSRTMLVDAVLLGFLVWLVGYLAGIALYFVFAPDILGWVLFMIFTPIVILLCYWRFGKRREGISYYALVAAVWFIIAVVCDYLFLVRLLNPQAYYKLDVYVYYASTFLIPFLAGAKFGRKRP